MVGQVAPGEASTVSDEVTDSAQHLVVLIVAGVLVGARGRLADVGCPWVRERPEGGHWLNPEAMTAEGVMSGAEGRILALARSLLDGTPVDMSEATTSLDPSGNSTIVGAVSIACDR